MVAVRRATSNTVGAVGAVHLISRRTLLRAFASGGAGAFVSGVLVPRALAAPAPRRQPLQTLYRLSSGRHACRSCKAHGANHYFRTPEAADGHRAHGGCNCRILAQQVPAASYYSYFRNGDHYDVRQDPAVQTGER